MKAPLSLALLFCSAFTFAQTEAILHSFSTGTSDGNTPMAGLVMESTGSLYGTAFSGGANNTGVIFKISAGDESVLYNFAAVGTNGPKNPNAALLLDASGNLYGTSTNGGGACIALGTAFEFLPAIKGGTIKILRSFGCENNAISPAGLVFDSSGNLWGTSESGGSANSGSIYKMIPTQTGGWIESQVYGRFGGQKGISPVGPLVIDAAGNVYGATATDGTLGKGTVFEFNAATSRLRYLFKFNGLDGATPGAGLIFDAQGNLYGTTTAGGSGGKGNVYELTTNGAGGWTETVLFAFNGANGQAPGGLVMDASGNLLGLTAQGGKFGSGVAYKLSNSNGIWSQTVLWNFGGKGDGATPVGSLIVDASGNLYGATSGGGASGVGTVFEIVP